MEVRCPNCGEGNPDRAKFCLECGTALKPAAAAEAPRGESRRTVTVLFADMVGFTSLGETIDQESLRRVMDSFYAEMREAIESERGTLAKFIGDAVLAVWGTPQVHEDDAVRAIRGAEAMRAALRALNEDLQARWGVRVGLRTGVHTGEVVVDPSRPADLLVGDTLNTAARLEQAAADGEILVGPETYRLVRDAAVLEEAAPLALKGKRRPLTPWRLLDGAHAPAGAAPRRQAPLVGRTAELARLREAFDRACETQHAQCFVVVGGPGVGKTRLVREFTRGLGDEATVLVGRADQAGAGSTLGPIAALLWAAAGLEEGADADAARPVLEAAFAEDEEQDGRVVEALLGVLGLGPAAAPEETAWAVRRFLETIARDGPLVTVLDDAHLAGPALLDLVEHVRDWGRGPMLGLVLARPELRDEHPALAIGALGLEPLAPDGSADLVRGLLGDADLPPALARRVLETTGGNPLFLGEMLRMLVDDGVLRHDGEGWTAEVADVSVPPTINALLDARLDTLAPAERTVVERAAVIGPSFPVGGVAALVERPVSDQLEALRRKELVAPEGTLWLDEPLFRFHHVLVRDAAYRSLLKQARAELHERFADWLETHGGDEDERIGFHLERALGYRAELGPLEPEGEAMAARAAERLRAAGARALAREDLAAAIALLGRAVGLAAAETRTEVLIELAEAELSAGQTAQAERTVEELAVVRHDPRAAAWATAFAVQLVALTGEPGLHEAVEHATAAAAELAALDDRAGEAKAHHVAALAHGLLSEVAAAEAALDRALVAARAAGDRRRTTAVLSGAPRAALWGPSPVVRASGRCLDVVRILRMTEGNRHLEAAALRCQAVLEAMRGRFEAARGIAADCRATFEELGLTLELLELDTSAAMVEAMAGEPAAARSLLARARTGFEALGAGSGAALATALEARAALELGEVEAAEALTTAAEAHGSEDLKTTLALLGVRAEALAAQGDLETARELAERAVALAEPTDALADHADALMALAAVARVDGRAEDERAALDAARALYGRKDHTVGVARVDALLGAAAPTAAPAAEPLPADGLRRPVSEMARHHGVIWRRAYESQDFAQLDEVMDPGVVMVDRRWGDAIVRGRDAVRAQLNAMLGTAADLTMLSDVRAGLDDGTTMVSAGQNHFEGTAQDGAGRFVVRLGWLQRARHGLSVLIESVDGEDPVALMSRFDELCDEAFGGVTLHPAARGPIAPPVVARRIAFLRALDARDWDGMAAGYAEDIRRVDHRQLAWAEEVGRDAVIDGLRSVTGGTEALRYADAMLATAIAPDGADVSLSVATLSGRAERGSAFEASAAGVSVEHDGRITRVEMYPDDEAGLAAAWARYLELADLPSVRLAHEFVARFNAGDLDAVGEVFAPDAVGVDRRFLAQPALIGHDQLMANMRSIVESSRAQLRWETLAACRGVAAGLQTYSGIPGESDLGPWETQLAAVRTVDAEGRCDRVEIFDGDNRDAMLRRYEELATEDAGNSLARPMAHKVTLIPGDGTGPELIDATRKVLEATGVAFDWDEHPAGEDIYNEEGTPFPDRTLESIKANGVGIKGPTTTPVGSGFRSVNVLLRKELDLYSCIRPCKAYEGVRTRFPETDIVIVRENTEDLYAGIEFEKDTEDEEKLAEFIKSLDSTARIREHTGISIKPISVFGSERIVRSAFDYATENGRGKVTAAHKANIMKHTDGLFLDTARKVAEDYPDIEFEDRIIDNLCNQLVSRPEEYDVIVLPNLYGDIVSDLGAGMIGGLGLAPGANIGTEAAMFEATHGSAPKYKGQNRVNPTALLLSGVLMLQHLEERDAAEKMERAIAEVIRKGDKVTYDLKPTRDDPSAVGTSEYADAVIEEMNA